MVNKETKVSLFNPLTANPKHIRAKNTSVDYVKKKFQTENL